MAESKDLESHHQHNHQLQEQQQTFMIHQPQVPQYPTMVLQLQQQTTVVPEQQVAVAVSHPTGYSRVASVSLGALHIGMCFMSIICGIVAIESEASGSSSGSGFWCGIIYGIVGSIAIAAGVKPSKALIIVAIVLSLVAIGFGITQLTLAVISLVNTVFCGANFCFIEGSPSALISSAAMGTYGFWEMLLGLFLFIVGIRALCCPPKSQTLVVPPLPSVTTPLTSAPVWDHSSPPALSNAAFDYEEEEGATASANYENIRVHPKFTL